MYTRSDSDLYVTDAAKKCHWLLHDRKEDHTHGQKILYTYIEEAQEVFNSTLAFVLAKDHFITYEDERHLESMLTLLLDARKTWQEEQPRE